METKKVTKKTWKDMRGLEHKSYEDLELGIV